MIRFKWEVTYQSSLGRSVIRNITIDARRDGRYSSCETPSRAPGNFELSAKKNVPTEVALPKNNPIYVHFTTVDGIIGDKERIDNEKYSKINESSRSFLYKTDHVPIRIFALGFKSDVFKKKNEYLRSQNLSTIKRAALRYINLPVHQEFEFVTLPLYYGVNSQLMKEIIMLGKNIKDKEGRYVAGFIDMRDSNTFSIFMDLVENEQLYDVLDVVLIKWVNPEKRLNSYYRLEDLLIDTYSKEKYPDFPPVIMVGTLRKADYSTHISGVHYTHVFGGDLHNLYKSNNRFVPPKNGSIKPPQFFNREELTVKPILNNDEIENLAHHPLIKMNNDLKEVVDNYKEWTAEAKKRTSANGLAYLLETYDSTEEFKLEQKYLKNDEIREYYNSKKILKNKTQPIIHL